jgi:mannose-6-phosphate isomerase-like protein (cupin superfamily)
MEVSRRELFMKTVAPSGRTQPLWFIDNLVHIHVDGATSGGALALLDERGRRGNMPPLHVHRRDDETFYVLEGELTLFVAGEQIVLGPGQAALAPRDVPHAYRVSQRRPAGW